jgi:alcohol dehydrogenase (NADP+)
VRLATDYDLQPLLVLAHGKTPMPKRKPSPRPSKPATDTLTQPDCSFSSIHPPSYHINVHDSYGTEPAVARGIKNSGVPRHEIFITTKLWNNSHHPDDVEPAIDASLKDLQTDYLDLYLMHWPSPFARSEKLMPKDDNGKMQTGDTDYVDVSLPGNTIFETLANPKYQTWKAMEKVFKSGKARAIGVSNFSKAELERLLKESDVVPAAHQIECHPWLQQKSFTDFHKEKGIHVQQYSP